MSDRSNLFVGRIVDGKFVLNDREEFAALKGKLEGQSIELTLRKQPVQRSTDANRFYWGVVVKALSEFSGHSREEVHAGLKAKFLTDKETADDPFPIIRSTTELSVAEFAKYLDKCIQLASEFGIRLPEPH
jgi:hypothetical protein